MSCHAELKVQGGNLLDRCLNGIQRLRRHSKLVAGFKIHLLRRIALNYKKIMVALCGAMGCGFAMAHSASYDHTHRLLESPVIFLCLIVCVGVGATIFQSSARATRAMPIEIDRGRDRNP